MYKGHPQLYLYLGGGLTLQCGRAVLKQKSWMNLNKKNIVHEDKEMRNKIVFSEKGKESND